VAQGMHSTLSTVGRKVGNNFDEITLPNGDKVYKAVIEVQDSAGNWIAKNGNKGVSSFFPDNWGYQKIVDSINRAKSAGSKVHPNDPTKNIHEGFDDLTGITINYYLDNTGKIISAFPKI
jgi:Bacterial EndoU nuclease